LKKRGLPASELLQIALRAGLERQDALDETSRYLEELLVPRGEVRRECWPTEYSSDTTV
jgi:hypothetical protein